MSTVAFPSNLFEDPKKIKIYNLSREWLRFAIYFASVAFLVIRIASQFNKNGEKKDIILAQISLILLMSSMSIIISSITLFRFFCDKKYKEGTRKRRQAGNWIALISSIATIVQVASSIIMFDISSKENSNVTLNTISIFIGTLMSVLTLYFIALPCKEYDCNFSKTQSEKEEDKKKQEKYYKEQKIHKKVIKVLWAMLILELINVVPKVIDLLEKKGSFIIENVTFNLGDNVTYYFNFSTTIRILCAIIMMGLSTYRMVIEQNSELSDVNITQATDQQLDIH